VNTFFLADAAALSTGVVFMLLVGVVLLVLVRATCGAMRITLTSTVARILNGSIVVTFALFAIFVYVRFKVIG